MYYGYLFNLTRVCMSIGLINNPDFIGSTHIDKRNINHCHQNGNTCHETSVDGSLLRRLFLYLNQYRNNTIPSFTRAVQIQCCSTMEKGLLQRFRERPYMLILHPGTFGNERIIDSSNGLRRGYIIGNLLVSCNLFLL